MNVGERFMDQVLSISENKKKITKFVFKTQGLKLLADFNILNTYLLA